MNDQNDSVTWEQITERAVDTAYRAVGAVFVGEKLKQLSLGSSYRRSLTAEEVLSWAGRLMEVLYRSLSLMGKIELENGLPVLKISPDSQYGLPENSMISLLTARLQALSLRYLDES